MNDFALQNWKIFFLFDASSLSDETSRVCVFFFLCWGFLLLLIDSFLLLVIIIMIIIIKQTLIGNIYKVTKERCGGTPTLQQWAWLPFAKGCVLLWIFPLWVLPSASFSSSPFLVLLSRSRFYSYFFCFNGINKQQFSSVLTLKWKIYSAFIRFIPLFSQFPLTQISYNLFYFAISLRISFNFTTSNSSISSALFFILLH